MWYQENNLESMLKIILEWSDSKPEFDDEVFRGIKKNYDKYGNFTPSQKRAIENVYYKWKVDKWYDNKLSTEY